VISYKNRRKYEEISENNQYENEREENEEIWRNEWKMMAKEAEEREEEMTNEENERICEEWRKANEMTISKK